MIFVCKDDTDVNRAFGSARKGDTIQFYSGGIFTRGSATRRVPMGVDIWSPPLGMRFEYKGDVTVRAND